MIMRVLHPFFIFQQGILGNVLKKQWNGFIHQNVLDSLPFFQLQALSKTGKNKSIPLRKRIIDQNFPVILIFSTQSLCFTHDLQQQSNLISKMKLLGNKDTKTTAKQTTPSKPVENLPPAIIAQSNDFKATLQSWVGTTKSYLNTWKTTTCAWCDSDEAKQISRVRKQFATDYCHPLGDFYRSLPDDITSWKSGLTGRYNAHERLFALEGMTLLVALSTLRFKPNIGFSKRFLFSVRNSAVTFLLGGLLIAPQIYNPLIKSDF